MRSFLRISPDLVLEKERDGYSPAAIAAYLALLCAGARQNPAGRFTNRLVLRGHLGKHARFIALLVEQKDLEKLADGGYFIVGWDEWQEGDLTAAERMRRYRAGRGKGNDSDDGDRNASDTIVLSSNSSSSFSAPSVTAQNGQVKNPAEKIREATARAGLRK